MHPYPFLVYFYSTESTSILNFTQIILTIISECSDQSSESFQTSDKSTFIPTQKCQFHSTSYKKTCRFCKKILKSIQQNKQQEQNNQNKISIQLTQVPHYKFKIYGSKQTFNINTKLRQNILQNSYFNQLHSINNYQQIIQEISRWTNLSPYKKANLDIPSQLFCCLYKLFLMRLTNEQVKGLIDNPNIYVRAIGFIFIRYICEPKKIFSWYFPYLLQQKQIPLPSIKIPIRIFLKNLMLSSVLNLAFPRLPLKIEEQIKQKLEDIDLFIERKRMNMQMWSSFVVGKNVVIVGSCEIRKINKVCKEGVWVYGDDGLSQYYDLGLIQLINEQQQEKQKNLKIQNQIIKQNHNDYINEEQKVTKIQKRNDQEGQTIQKNSNQKNNEYKSFISSSSRLSHSSSSSSVSQQRRRIRSRNKRKR